MQKKLKIAVQLYGHLRTFDICAPYLRKHLLELYDCDVFIHTWDQTEHTTKSWYDNSIKTKPFLVDEEVIAKLTHFYSPKKMLIETQNLFSETEAYGSSSKIQISLQGLKYMLYGQFKANELRKRYENENLVSYDYVLTVRPDVQLLTDLRFEQYKNEFSFNPRSSIHFLHRSEIKLCGDKFYNYPLIADCLYFSTPNLMNEITDTFLEFDRFFKEVKITYPPGVENPELAIFERLYQRGITPRQYQFYFAIKRKNDKDDIKLLPPEPRKTYSNWELLTNKQFTRKQKLKNAIKLIVDIILKLTPQPFIKVFQRCLYWVLLVDRYIKSKEINES